MAESQVPYPYQPPQLQAIRASISQPRFATYLAKGGGHEQYAMALYLYNARVAKAFLYPLNVAEVTLRNAVDAILVATFGQKWHEEKSFRDRTLSPEGLATLNKAIQRAGNGAHRSQIVATLTFDFWSNLFRPAYGDLWRTRVNIAFPNLRHGEGRKDIQNLVKPINAFRNRVAHHEPILDANVTDTYAKIVELTEKRCAETAAWMKYHSTVAAVVRTRPKLAGQIGMPLANKLDPAFLSVTPHTPLSDIFDNFDERHPAIVCVDAAGRPTAAFTLSDVTRYLSQQGKAADGLVALKEHSVANLIAHSNVNGRWSQMGSDEAFGLAIRELQRPLVQVLVGLDSSGKATGAILRAHRRY